MEDNSRQNSNIYYTDNSTVFCICDPNSEFDGRHLCLNNMVRPVFLRLILVNFCKTVGWQAIHIGNPSLNPTSRALRKSNALHGSPLLNKVSTGISLRWSVWFEILHHKIFIGVRKVPICRTERGFWLIFCDIYKKELKSQFWQGQSRCNL